MATGLLLSSVEELQHGTQRITSHLDRLTAVEKDLNALRAAAAVKEDNAKVRAEMKKVYVSLSSVISGGVWEGGGPTQGERLNPSVAPPPLSVCFIHGCVLYSHAAAVVIDMTPELSRNGGGMAACRRLYDVEACGSSLWAQPVGTANSPCPRCPTPMVSMTACALVQLFSLTGRDTSSILLHTERD